MPENTKTSVHSALAGVQQDLKAQKDQYNEFGGYKFRSAEGILREAKPVLERYGLLLTMTDKPIMVGDWHYNETTATVTLIADPTQQISVTASARESEQRAKMDSAQISGGAISYARKYAMGALFALDDGRDDPDASNRQGYDEVPAAQNHEPTFTPETCACCGRPIVGGKLHGRILSVGQIADGTAQKYGEKLCMECFAKRMRTEKEQAQSA